MIYASEPVHELTESVLVEWDHQFREHRYSLTQLDACKRQLVKTAADAPPDDLAILSGEEQWCELKREETFVAEETCRPVRPRRRRAGGPVKQI